MASSVDRRGEHRPFGHILRVHHTAYCAGKIKTSDARGASIERQLVVERIRRCVQILKPCNPTTIRIIGDLSVRCHTHSKYQSSLERCAVADTTAVAVRPQTHIRVRVSSRRVQRPLNRKELRPRRGANRSRSVCLPHHHRNASRRAVIIAGIDISRAARSKRRLIA